MLAAKVTVQYRHPLPLEQTLFCHWVQYTLYQTPVQIPGLATQTAEITVRIVDEAESQYLNHTWRGQAKPTNVLSFPFELPPQADLPILGDIILCAPVAMAEAKVQGRSLEAHLAHLVVHGMLHLIGYDHQETTAAHQMETLEVNMLRALGYPDPYL
jgi:probable rRNA maturation factor